MTTPSLGSEVHGQLCRTERAGSPCNAEHAALLVPVERKIHREQRVRIERTGQGALQQGLLDIWREQPEADPLPGPRVDRRPHLRMRCGIERRGVIFGQLAVGDPDEFSQAGCIGIFPLAPDVG